MKKPVIALVLIGGFLLVSNLIFAQNAPLAAGGDNSTTTNQADAGTQVNSAGGY
jgi:hypothetical protein